MERDSRRPLSETTRSLRDLQDWGVDLSLIESSLARSPRQRLDIMLERLALVTALQRGIDHHPLTH